MHQGFQCILDQQFCFRVDTGSRFIQHKDLGVIGKGARKSQKLLLAYGKGGSSFADLGRILTWKLLNETGCVNSSGRILCHFLCYGFVAEPDVLVDASGEKKHVLKNNPYLNHLALDAFAQLGERVTERMEQ